MKTNLNKLHIAAVFVVFDVVVCDRTTFHRAMITDQWTSQWGNGGMKWTKKKLKLKF